MATKPKRAARAKKRKKPAALSPTQLTLRECRKRSWPAQKVEYWQPHSRRRIDLFGFIDIVTLDDVGGVLGIQATTWSAISTRVRKIEAIEEAVSWLAHGNRIQVWGWAKRPQKPGSRRLTWQVKIATLRLEQREPLLVTPDGSPLVASADTHGLIVKP
jgi:hypothetical protein